MPKLKPCPSCYTPLGKNSPRGACIIEAFAAMLVDRGHSRNTIVARLPYLDIDQFWPAIGQVADDLADALKLEVLDGEQPDGDRRTG